MFRKITRRLDNQCHFNKNDLFFNEFIIKIDKITIIFNLSFIFLVACRNDDIRNFLIKNSSIHGDILILRRKLYLYFVILIIPPSFYE